MINDSKAFTFRVTLFNKNKEGLLHITSNELVVRPGEDLDTDFWFDYFIKRYTDDIVIIQDEYGALVSPKEYIYAAKVFGIFYRFNKRAYYEFVKLSDDLFDAEAKETIIMLRDRYTKHLKNSIHSYKKSIEEYKSSINICNDSISRCKDELKDLTK
jgi:hypothetical protein